MILCFITTFFTSDLKQDYQLYTRRVIDWTGLAGIVEIPLGQPAWLGQKPIICGLLGETLKINVQGRLAALLVAPMLPSGSMSGMRLVAGEGLEPPTPGL